MPNILVGIIPKGAEMKVLPRAGTPAPRVGLLLPYWSFFEASAGGIDLRSDREGVSQRIAGRLTDLGFDVVCTSMVDSESVARSAADRFRDQDAEAVLALFTMAVPPSYSLAALDDVIVLPLVIWTVQIAVRDGLSMSDIVVDGGTVGTAMLTNMLARTGRPFGLVFGPEDDAAIVDEVRDNLNAATLAHRLRKARIGRIGHPVPGYLCVDADDSLLEQALGVTIARLSPGDLQRRYRSTDASATSELAKEVRSTFEFTDGVGARGSLSDSLRLAQALRELDEEFELDAGTLNCHVPELRYADDPGITPCFALGHETTRGVPWSCTGDVLTAIAMLVAKHLSGAAFYHEIESIDRDTGECMLANSGEHDLAWCDEDETPLLRPNPWFRNDSRCGTCAWFPLRAGPATLVAFTPVAGEPSGFRFIAAEGYITERRVSASPTVGGAFRFSGDGDSTAAWRQWARAGANHHDALAAGHIAGQVAALTGYLGVGFVRVS